MKIFTTRHGISPIVATVLVVAATLIAFVATAGYVFGIFGSAATTANVQVTVSTLRASDFSTSGVTTTFTCGSATNSFVTLLNTGASSTNVATVTVLWAGANNAFTPTATCTVGASGLASSTQSILFASTSKLSAATVVGQTYSINVVLSNGVTLIYTGIFQ